MVSSGLEKGNMEISLQTPLKLSSFDSAACNRSVGRSVSWSVDWLDMD